MVLSEWFFMEPNYFIIYGITWKHQVSVVKAQKKEKRNEII